MLRRKKWKRILYPTLLVLLICEGLLGFTVIHLGMLPTKFLIPIMIGLVVFLVVDLVLLCAGMGKGPSKARKARRIIGIILAVIVSGLCVYGAFTVNKIDRTVTAVSDTDTTNKDKLKAVYGLYVLKDDPAVKLSDVSGYSLGMVSGQDAKSSEKALDQMQNKMAMAIEAKNYPSALTITDALYNQEVQMILINEVFVSFITEEKAYADFEEKTRKIESFEIHVSAAEEAAEEQENKEKSEQAAKEDEENGNRWKGTAVIHDIAKEPFVMYLAGADYYGTGINDRDFKLVENGRNDVNILMVVNPVTREILLCHIPRDFYIHNPAGGYELDRLTLCGLYGVKNSEATCAYTMKTYVNYYARINFGGFTRLIDALGGITVNSTEDFQSGNYHFVVGKNELDGEGALRYAREIKQFKEGDIARGGHQMQILQGVINKVTSSGASLLLNYSDIMNSIADFFDTDLTNDEMSSLVKMQLDKGGSWSVHSLNLGGEIIQAETYTNPGALKTLVVPDEKEIETFRSLVDKVFAGEKLTDADLKMD